MRRTRTNYAISNAILFCVFSILNVFASTIENQEMLIVFVLLFIAIGIGAQIYLAIGRLKDMNANPWWAVLTLLPFVSLILMFPSGTKGDNKYGPNPRTLKKE